MAKIRVYELAKTLNTNNKDLLDKIEEAGISVKNHMSALEEDEVATIKSYVLNKTDEEKKETRITDRVIRRRKVVTEESPQKEDKAKKEESAKKEEAEPEEVEVEPERKEEEPEKSEPEKKEEPKEVKSQEKKEDIPKETEQVKKVEEQKREEQKIDKKKLDKKPKKISRAKIIKLPDVKQEKPISTPPVADLQEKGYKQTASAESEDDEKGRKKTKKRSYKKREVIDKNELYSDDSSYLKRRRKKDRIKKSVAQKTQITTPKAIKRRIKMGGTIVLAELARKMGIKAGEVIKKLMTMNVMVTANQTIDFDTASIVAAEFSYEIEKNIFEEKEILKLNNEKEVDEKDLKDRAPVVTIMGHVDHGKTSLLDVIRKTKVTEGEAGGITQHIGAYSVRTHRGRICFIDTPGHEAFSSMRSRGAKITDIVILVVAADDGVRPQTIEAINHSKAANVPIIIAINKIDKEGANLDRVKRELSEKGVLTEDWGGEVLSVNVSAVTKEGIDNLLESILLQTEMLELKANPKGFATGYVIESRLDVGRGAIATILVKNGTLKKGDNVICGAYTGKIKAMFDDLGKPISKAGPSVPVEILGLDGVPEAGDELVALLDSKDAKQISEHRLQKQRHEELAKSNRASLETLFERMGEKKAKELNIIVKVDVQGSIEAIKQTISKISVQDVKVNIVHIAAGSIAESDISLAMISDAIVIGFNIRPASKIKDLAKEENVDMRFYNVVYDIEDDIRKAMLGIADSTFEEEISGKAEVRNTFVIPKKGTIAGSFITSGKIIRGYSARVLRDSVVKHEGKIESLRRFKDDVKEVANNYECGIGLENFNDIKVGDVIECFFVKEIKPT